MKIKNALYAQSGGVTAVINTSACAVLETAKQYSDQIGTVYAAHNGIYGALRDELIDTKHESDEAISTLFYTPGGAFGSCRYKLPSIESNQNEFKRLIEIFKAYNIGYFFYNGGNDSMDTALKVSQLSDKMGYPITCIGIPKTIDNDLVATDNSPGFGSAAKYLAISTLEASFDIASMHTTSTKVFILEVMGRHAGWLAAATGLATREEGDPPHIIIFPEIPLNKFDFLEKVKHYVSKYGYCVIAASEGAREQNGSFLSASTTVVDCFGHHQLGGVAPTLCNLIKKELGYKYHYAVADYLQRSARHIASKTDVEQAYAVGKKAVELALSGYNNVMATITRHSDRPYRWSVDATPLEEVANFEKKLPREFISPNGYHITAKCRTYLEPLIEGEEYPKYVRGLPKYAKMKKILNNNKVISKL